ncbi:MAG TPA: hypothetical protein VK436_02925 [Methanocella sp.]|nr:hypothetical protein [Methanocella sp.]
MTNYRDNGSDFQAITDHSVITKDPQVKGITYISGSEYSVMSNGGHMNGVWLSGKTTPSTNAVIIAQRIRDSGGKVIFNHPGSPTKGWTFKEIKAAAKPYDFYEMYDPGYPTIESYYDQMLQNNITMWATADDDDHSFKDGRFLKSYDVVNAYNSTSSEIKRQMSLGNFYAAMLDNGSYARINSISTSDGHNVVITSPDMCNFIWYTKDGVVKITNNTNTDSYDANPDDMYVRAELVLDNIPRLKSWTQPMLVENGSLSPTVCYGSLSPTVGLKTTPEYSNVGSIACILFIILIISAGAIAIMVIVRGLRPRN